MGTQPRPESAYFTLAQWCSVNKAWHDLPGQYESIRHAEDAATERGIYRVAFVSGGRRLTMEPFARVGDD
jgi:hypothetical protein